MSVENRQKIPVPRRSFLWSLNETSGEILTHVGPTEFTPSANDRIVRANDRGGFEQAPMEARPFVIAKDGQYIVLSNPIRADGMEAALNGSYVPGGNKEKDLVLGTTRIIPGPCAFPLWPGQSAEVRPAHKLGANHYLLVEVVGPLDEKAPYCRLVVSSALLSSAVIDSGDDAEREAGRQADGEASAPAGDASQLRLGQRIVIQGRHTQLFIPPSGIEIVPPVEESEPKDTDDEGVATLPAPVAQELAKLVTQVREGLSAKQFSVTKNELRHRQDLTMAQRAIMLATLDGTWETRQQVLVSARRGKVGDRGDRRQSPADPYARRAVVLGPKEYCILFDADGNPRIVRGPARVFPGPHDAFMQRGSRRRVYDAYELAEHQALWLRIITPCSRERLARHLPPGFELDREHYDAGHELIVRGLPSVFFPFIEAEIIHPVSREPHVGNDHDTVVIQAIGIDQKSGIYVRDLRTGMVKTVRGQTSYLVDPRSEEQVHRRVAREHWNLWIGRNENHKTTKDDAVTTPWALSITIPNNEACLVTSRHGRRVEVGPQVILLELEEQLTPLTLSKGPSKDGHATISTCFLRIRGGRFADSFDADSRDFVRFRIKLGLAGHFDGDRERWFDVEDPVKLVADVVRARVREAVRTRLARDVLADVPNIVRGALFGDDGVLRFTENGVVITAATVLAASIAEPELAELYTQLQRESLRLQVSDEKATRRIESARHQDTIDAEENAILRATAVRKADTEVVSAEQSHRVEHRRIELVAARRDTELDRQHKHNDLALEHELRAAKARSESSGSRRIADADADATAKERVNKVAEAHAARSAEIDASYVRALAEADAMRIHAIQRELVGALHAASDSEVMKAAASNMNLVSLLGGKTPLELLRNVVAGTPLERTARQMSARSSDGDGSAAAPAPREDG